MEKPTVLPIVSNDTYNSVVKSIKDTQSFITKYALHLKETNPVVLQFVKASIKGMELEMAVRVTARLFILHKMFESQVEANQLDKEFADANG